MYFFLLLLPKVHAVDALFHDLLIPVTFLDDVDQIAFYLLWQVGEDFSEDHSYQIGIVGDVLI